MSIDMAAYMRDRRAKRRAMVISWLGGKCVVCGTVENLEIDHIDPDLKSFDISRAQALDGPISRLREEAKKCQLLCHEHHLAKSQENEDLGGGQNKIENPEHGTSVMYHVHKCKCSDCRDWKRKYREKLVDSLGNPIVG